MTSDGVEYDTVELAVFKNPYIDTQIAPLVTETQKPTKISKIQKFDLEI